MTNTWIEEEIIAKAAYKQSLDEILIQAGMYNERSTDVERRAKLVTLVLIYQVYSYSCIGGSVEAQDE